MSFTNYFFSVCTTRLYYLCGRFNYAIDPVQLIQFATLLGINCHSDFISIVYLFLKNSLLMIARIIVPSQHFCPSFYHKPNT